MLDANAYGGDSFTDDAARHGDLASTDCDEQNHRFTEPAGIDGRKVFSSRGDQLGHRPAERAWKLIHRRHVHFVSRME
jgi:hypothetical protein